MTTTQAATGPSGRALNAANSVPSAEVKTRSSCETAAPERTGIGGSESASKHIRARTYRQEEGAKRRRCPGDGGAVAPRRDERSDPGPAGTRGRPALDHARACSPAGAVG